MTDGTQEESPRALSSKARLTRGATVTTGPGNHRSGKSPQHKGRGDGRRFEPGCYPVSATRLPLLCTIAKSICLPRAKVSVAVPKVPGATAPAPANRRALQEA